VVRRGRAYRYRLTPRRAGWLRVPAPVVKIDGRTLRGRVFALEVVEPDAQDEVRMQITADPTSVYPTERVTVTLSVLVKALPDELARRNPLSVQSTPPALDIPWVEDDRVPDGLEPAEDARAWLSRLRDPGGEGFSINDLADRSVFSLFERRALAFQPRPRRVERADADGKDVEYWLYEFRRSFVAKRPGRYTFGPATLKGTFATGVSSVGRLTGEKVYAVAPRLVVDVKQVPEADRPASYLGAVGRFTWSAELKPTRCKVGDPVTLVLALRGRGSLAAAAAPDLSQLPAVAENFKTYEGTRETKGDTCSFTYTLRPLSAEITEFPSILGSYFDVQRNRYVTLDTEPIAIQVEKAAALTGRHIVGAGSTARTPEALEVRREGIFANVTDPEDLADESVRAEYWALGLVGLAGLYGAIFAVTWYVRRRLADPALARRRAAAGRARRRLREGTTLLKTNNTQQGAEQVRGALVGLVADVANVAEAGMTSADACRRLRSFGADEELVGRLAGALEACDATRYTPAGTSVNGLADEAGLLLHSVVRSLKRRRCLR